MLALLWLIFIGAGTYIGHHWLERRTEARRGVVIGETSGQQSLRLTANRYGHYEVSGKTNGRKVVFLIDTGATGISIPEAIADKAGLERGRAFEVLTANGVTTVYATSIETLNIGPFVAKNVAAHINPSMDDNVALLGMSFLRHYELVQRSGELTISTY